MKQLVGGQDSLKFRFVLRRGDWANNRHEINYRHGLESAVNGEREGGGGGESTRESEKAFAHRARRLAITSLIDISSSVNPGSL